MKAVLIIFLLVIGIGLAYLVLWFTIRNQLGKKAVRLVVMKAD